MIIRSSGSRSTSVQQWGWNENLTPKSAVCLPTSLRFFARILAFSRERLALPSDLKALHRIDAAQGRMRSIEYHIDQLGIGEIHDHPQFRLALHQCPAVGMERKFDA